MRVYEIAKEVGIPNKDLLAKIRALGLEVNNHMSSLDADASRASSGPSRRRKRPQSVTRPRPSRPPSRRTVLRRRSSKAGRGGEGGETRSRATCHAVECDAHRRHAAPPPAIGSSVVADGAGRAVVDGRRRRTAGGEADAAARAKSSHDDTRRTARATWRSGSSGSSPEKPTVAPVQVRVKSEPDAKVTPRPSGRGRRAPPARAGDTSTDAAGGRPHATPPAPVAAAPAPAPPAPAAGSRVARRRARRSAVRRPRSRVIINEPARDGGSRGQRNIAPHRWSSIATIGVPSRRRRPPAVRVVRQRDPEPRSTVIDMPVPQAVQDFTDGPRARGESVRPSASRPRPELQRARARHRCARVRIPSPDRRSAAGRRASAPRSVASGGRYDHQPAAAHQDHRAHAARSAVAPPASARVRSAVASRSSSSAPVAVARVARADRGPISVARSCPSARRASRPSSPPRPSTSASSASRTPSSSPTSPATWA